MIKFKKFTETTIAPRRALLAKLARSRQQGYGVDRAEGMLGIHCIAAPILDRHEYPVGPITIAAPASRLPVEDFETVSRHVIAGAQMASTRFNH